MITSNIESAIKELERRGFAIDSVIESSLTREGERLRARIIRQINLMGISVTGDLRKSVTAQVDKVLLGWQMRVGPGVSYSVFVHEGTRPHYAPLSPLVEWVKKKGLSGVFSVKTKRRLGSAKTRQQQDIAAAKAVQSKIAKFGTRAQPFLSIVYAQEGDFVVDRISRNIASTIRSGQI
jgi:hypothetical protein